MTKVPFLAGSPASTATWVPFGCLGSSGPHFSSVALTAAKSESGAELRGGRWRSMVDRPGPGAAWIHLYQGEPKEAIDRFQIARILAPADALDWLLLTGI